MAFKAHRLNGLARNFGVSRAVVLAEDVETLAKQGTAAAVRSACDALQAAFARLEREATNRRANGSPTPGR